MCFHILYNLENPVIHYYTPPHYVYAQPATCRRGSFVEGAGYGAAKVGFFGGLGKKLIII